jgi:hypothetical protein
MDLGCSSTAISSLRIAVARCVAKGQNYPVCRPCSDSMTPRLLVLAFFKRCREHYPELPVLLCLQSFGNLRISSSGIIWKKAGGGKTVEIQQKGAPEPPERPVSPQVAIYDRLSSPWKVPVYGCPPAFHQPLCACAPVKCAADPVAQTLRGSCGARPRAGASWGCSGRPRPSCNSWASAMM